MRLGARLEPRINQLARLVIERQRAKIPGYDRLPGDMQDLEIASAARQAIRSVLRCTQGLADPEAEVFRERAAQRAAEGVPLVGLLRSYHVGAEALTDALCAAARPGEDAALLWLVRHQFRTVNAMVEQATEAYLMEMADQQGLGGSWPQRWSAVMRRRRWPFVAACLSNPATSCSASAPLCSRSRWPRDDSSIRSWAGWRHLRKAESSACRTTKVATSCSPSAHRTPISSGACPPACPGR